MTPYVSRHNFQTQPHQNKPKTPDCKHYMNAQLSWEVINPNSQKENSPSATPPPWIWSGRADGFTFTISRCWVLGSRWVEEKIWGFGFLCCGWVWLYFVFLLIRQNGSILKLPTFLSLLSETSFILYIWYGNQKRKKKKKRQVSTPKCHLTARINWEYVFTNWIKF